MVLIRLKKIYIEACAFLLERASNPALVSEEEAEEVLGQFVGHGRNLLELQIAYLGPDHVDVGRASYDVAEGIGSLLAKKSGKLAGLFGFKNSLEASKYASECRKEFERIKKLYD